MNLLLAIFIDDKNSHEYFGHKYNVSNNIKGWIKSISKNLKFN